MSDFNFNEYRIIIMRKDRKVYFETDRLNIAAFIPDDIDLIMEYRNDPEWMIYQGFKCLSRKEYCDELLKEPDFSRGAQLAVLCKGILIGDLFLKIEKESAEIGYTLNKRYTGKGYCTEAVLGLCSFLKDQKVRLVRAEADEANTASIKALTRTGFLLQGNIDHYRLYEKAL